MTDLVDVRRCGVHPDAVAVDTCSRCGAFVCSSCLELLGEEAFCQSCYQKRDVTGRPSTRAITALLLGAFSLICGFPLGIPAILVAWRERKAIDAGQAPVSGRSYVAVARVLGWVSVVASVVLVATLSWRLFGPWSLSQWLGTEEQPVEQSEDAPSSTNDMAR